MISQALIKRDIKINRKLWLVITGTMALLLFLLIFSSKGMGPSGSSIVAQFYTLFAPLLFLFFSGPANNKLIAAQVDNGSLAYVMSAPLKREAVVITKMLYSLLSVAAMYVIFIAVGICGNVIFETGMEVKGFLLLNLGSLLLSFCISGIGFFASCLFNTSGSATAIGVGLPMAFVLLNLAGLIFAGNDLLKYCKYLTLNSLLNSSDILSYSSNMVWEFLLMLGISVILYASGAMIFKKKDLPL